jgi:hypothetical protein
MNDRDLLRSEQLLADREAANRVCDPAASIANHVRVAFLETECARRIDARIHANDERDLAAWRKRQLALLKLLGVATIGTQQFIGDGHRNAPGYRDPAWAGAEAARAVPRVNLGWLRFAAFIAVFPHGRATAEHGSSVPQNCISLEPWVEPDQGLRPHEY